MKKGKKKRRLSFDWALLATAAIFFLLGRFIAPHYEKLFMDAGIFDEVFPVSEYSLILAAVLAGGFVLLWVVRLLWKKG